MRTKRRGIGQGRAACALVAVLVLLGRGFVAAGTDGGEEDVNYGPTAFTYYPPKDVEGVPGHVIKIFSWTRSEDPEGGKIEYRLSLYQNDQEIFRREHIAERFCCVDLTEEAPAFDPAEEWHFEVVALDPFWQEELPTIGIRDQPGKFTAETVSSVTVPAYVYGYIYDIENDRPVTDAVVFTPNASTTSDDGSYGLQVQAGTVTLAVSASGYESWTTELEIEEGGIHCINIPLTRTFFEYRGTVRVDVRDSATSKPVRAAVLYYQETEIPVEGGTYLLTLPEGRYTLRCVAEGYGESEIDILVRRNQTALENFTLTATEEQIWAERQVLSAEEPEADPRYLDVGFSGMAGDYDVYVVAQVASQTFYFLTSTEGDWSTANEPVPVGEGIAMPNGNFSIRLLKSAIETSDGPEVNVLVICTRPGDEVTDFDAWEGWAIVNWQ